MENEVNINLDEININKNKPITIGLSNKLRGLLKFKSEDVLLLGILFILIEEGIDDELLILLIILLILTDE